LAASHARYSGDAGRAWVAALPRLAADMQERWELRADGEPMSGAAALVLPVLLADGTAAVLKLQPVDDETAGEPIALDAWKGRGAVRLLRHDSGSGSMLLERLDAGRSLGSIDDDLTALRTLSELLARLTSVEAPATIRRLDTIAAGLLARVPPGADELVKTCAAAVKEVLPESGDRLLHWDLHYDNVLAGRGEWLAIDPKPLAGDPCFDLLPALHNRWDDVVATGNVRAAVKRRFDLMTDVLGLDRQRAVAWTLGRVLQNLLWEVELGADTWLGDPDRAIAAALLGR
jgi:streptomycin 6-kinase